MRNGKGSKPRPTDMKAYGKNYDEILWNSEQARQRMWKQVSITLHDLSLDRISQKAKEFVKR